MDYSKMTVEELQKRNHALMAAKDAIQEEQRAIQAILDARTHSTEISQLEARIQALRGPRRVVAPVGVPTAEVVLPPVPVLPLTDPDANLRVPWWKRLWGG